MRLSEAIRLGSLLGPQLTDGRMLGPGNSSCALGAALLALGVQCDETRYPPEGINNASELMDALLAGLSETEAKHNGLIRQRFPALDNSLAASSTDLPLFLNRDCTIMSMIWALNDTIKISRQEIADWLVRNDLDLESIDPPQQEQHEHQADLVTA